jgi:outer membrane protein TolC
VTLTWLLWDGGERGAEESERRALASASELELRALARDVDRQVKDALVALATGQAAERQAEIAAKAAQANLQLFEAEVEWIRARYDTARAFLEVRRALGLDPLGRMMK